MYVFLRVAVGGSEKSRLSQGIARALNIFRGVQPTPKFQLTVTPPEQRQKMVRMKFGRAAALCDAEEPNWSVPKCWEQVDGF